MTDQPIPIEEARQRDQEKKRRFNAFRTLPYNIEAEKSLLGAIFANNKAYERVADFLKPGHFAMVENGLIFTAIGRLIDSGHVADAVTLKRYFEQDTGLADIGGGGYLVDLVGSVVSIVNAGEYGRIVYDLFLKRELIGLGEDVVNRAYSGDVEDSAADQVEALEAGLARIDDFATGRDHDPGRQMDETLRGIEQAFRNDGPPPGVTTGLIDLDKKMGRLRKQALYILAARPSMGKTALALHIAEAVSKNFAVAFFSHEMSAPEIHTRRLAGATGIAASKLDEGLLEREEMDRTIVASGPLRDKPLLIDDTPALTVRAITRRARRLQRKQGGLGLVVVDHLGLVRPEDLKAQKVHQIEAITGGLKAMAKELDVPVLLLCQLNRALEQRDDKRPMLSDLRDSGAIEQDADAVIFLFREAYYLERERPKSKSGETRETFAGRVADHETNLAVVRNQATAIVAKRRNGPTGSVELHFDGPTIGFDNAARDQEATL